MEGAAWSVWKKISGPDPLASPPPSLDARLHYATISEIIYNTHPTVMYIPTTTLFPMLPHQENLQQLDRDG